MSESTKTDLRAWLEEAVDHYIQQGEIPDAYPPGVGDVRWEHNAPLAWTPEAPKPGFTFTAELDNGETIETWRP